MFGFVKKEGRLGLPPGAQFSFTAGVYLAYHLGFYFPAAADLQGCHGDGDEKVAAWVSTFWRQGPSS